MFEDMGADNKSPYEREESAVGRTKSLVEHLQLLSVLENHSSDWMIFTECDDQFIPSFLQCGVCLHIE